MKKYLALIGITLISSCAFANNTQQSIDPEQVKRFGLALTQIKQLYVEPVSDEELFNNAINGMLKGLDPHSALLDRKSVV